MVVSDRAETPKAAVTVGELRRDARFSAQAVLEEHWPEGTLPVDPVIVARRVGVEVYSTQLGNDVFGMLVGTESGADIFLDSDQPEKRYRFTCAHELGHYVDRSSQLEGDLTYIDRRSESGRGSRDEIWANEFAGSLLMPPRELKVMIDAGLSDVKIAESFGVSLSALGYRRQVLNV